MSGLQFFRGSRWLYMPEVCLLTGVLLSVHIPTALSRRSLTKQYLGQRSLKMGSVMLIISL